MTTSQPDSLSSKTVSNPWRTFIENVISGNNYFRTSEYHELLADLDRLYALEQQASPAPATALMHKLRECLTTAAGLGNTTFAPVPIETVEHLMNRLAVETSERQSYQDPDGCPTELAVLKRFWREYNAPMPSQCAHQWKYFETVETLKGGCGFKRCELCGTERVAEKRSQEEPTQAPFPYPCDRIGWICSICHGWNSDKILHCAHTHATREVGAEKMPDLTGGYPECFGSAGAPRSEEEYRARVNALALECAQASAVVRSPEKATGKTIHFREDPKSGELLVADSPVKAAAPHTTEQDFQHWLSYSGKFGHDEAAMRAAYYAGANAEPPESGTPHGEAGDRAGPRVSPVDILHLRQRMAELAGSLQHELEKEAEPERWYKIGSLLSQLNELEKQMVVRPENGGGKQT